MQTLWQDLRYGARALLKKPVFTLIVVLTLALGVGANTAIFSVFNGVILKPLPYKDPDRMVNVRRSDGLGLGLGAAFALNRLIASQLFGVTATDLLTYGGVATLLAMVSMAACYIPARRVARVDPMVALRRE